MFDQGKAGAKEEMLEFLTGTQFAGGFDCISTDETARACADVVSALGGGVMPMVLWAPENLPENVEAVMGM